MRKTSRISWNPNSEHLITFHHGTSSHEEETAYFHSSLSKANKQRVGFTTHALLYDLIGHGLVWSGKQNYKRAQITFGKYRLYWINDVEDNDRAVQTTVIILFLRWLCLYDLELNGTRSFQHILNWIWDVLCFSWGGTMYSIFLHQFIISACSGYV